MSVKTKSNKAKARRLQDKIRDDLLEFDTTLVKDIDVRSAIMGESGVDIKLSDRAKKVFPFAIECKAQKSPTVYKQYEQAKANADGLEPLLVVKKDRCKPLVVMDWEYFLNLWRDA